MTRREWLALAAAPYGAAQNDGSTVIVNARIADGTGAPLREGALRMQKDRITRIGRFQPAAGETVVDAKGLVVTPGFIDIHNHSSSGLDTDPLAASQVAQGITSVVLGPDGGSPWPIGEWLEGRRAKTAAVNVATLVGHATVRRQVMGDDYKRAATAEETSRMAALVDAAMRQGAVGLSSGLEYEVGSYSTLDELVALARAAAKHGGFYMTHIRDEADKAVEALEEEIAIGRRAGIAIQHSHIKLGTVAVWRSAEKYSRIIEAARASGVDFLADCYPYDAWHSTIKVLVPDKRYEDPASVAKALADVGGAERITISRFSPRPAYASHTLAELARSAGVTDVEMYIRIIREGKAADSDAGVICRAMTEEDIRDFYRKPWVMVSSDGGIGARHPRGAGTFPRVLGLFVREKRWLTLPQAIHKMTALPAKRLGWKDRGVLREGAFADLVLLDPETVMDRATFAKPFEVPVGIAKVFVNGVVVWEGGKTTGARPGRVLRG